MEIVKLDGFTVDGLGNVIGAEQDLVAGDVCRINGKIEQIWSPPAPLPEPAPVVFNSADWQEYAYGVLGTLAVPNGSFQEKLESGLERYGEIILAARNSVAPKTVASYEQYRRAENFRLDKVTLFLQVLVADGQIVTPTEYTAIIASWPKK